MAALSTIEILIERTIAASAKNTMHFESINSGLLIMPFALQNVLNDIKEDIQGRIDSAHEIFASRQGAGLQTPIYARDAITVFCLRGSLDVTQWQGNDCLGRTWSETTTMYSNVSGFSCETVPFTECVVATDPDQPPIRVEIPPYSIFTLSASADFFGLLIRSEDNETPIPKNATKWGRLSFVDPNSRPVTYSI